MLEAARRPMSTDTRLPREKDSPFDPAANLRNGSFSRTISKCPRAIVTSARPDHASACCPIAQHEPNEAGSVREMLQPLRNRASSEGARPYNLRTQGSLQATHSLPRVVAAMRAPSTV